MSDMHNRWWHRVSWRHIAIAATAVVLVGAGCWASAHLSNARPAGAPQPTTVVATPTPPRSTHSDTLDGQTEQWTYSTDTPTIDVTTPVTTTVQDYATAYYTNRYDSTGQLRPWEEIDNVLAPVATVGWRVYLTEVPDNQTVNLTPGIDAVTTAACTQHDNDTSPGRWEGTCTIDITTTGHTERVTVAVTAIVDEDGWKIDTWELEP